MIAIITGLIAAVLYTTGTWLQLRLLTSTVQAGTAPQRTAPLILLLAGAALLAHLANTILLIKSSAGYDFGFFRVATLFSWVMVLTVLLTSLTKPLANLFIALFPLAIVSILCSTFLPSHYNPNPDLTGGVALHSVLGILAFSLLTIAALQALLVAWLNRELKQRCSQWRRCCSPSSRLVSSLCLVSLSAALSSWMTCSRSIWPTRRY